ncbi:MAG: sigma 54-interacting transcriptional regulator [Solirubrobacterales bacterium]
MENLVEIIGIYEENCTNCHQCIAVCPVKVCSDGSGNVVKFDNELCIGCGRCIEACIKSHGGQAEKSARFAYDDAPRFAADLLNIDIVALIAPSAYGNFQLPRLITALKNLGVSHVYDVSLGAEITIAAYHEAIEKGLAKTPLIAQPCPAVVKYIELYRPGLIEHLAPIGSPVHNLAVYVQSLHPKAALAFISPCLAKRREFKDSGIVQYNVTFQSLQQVLRDKNIDLETLEDSPFDNPVPASIAVNFSSSGGLKESYLHHYPETPSSRIMRVDGQMVFERYLESLEKAIQHQSPNLPLIVDVLSCDKGCNMGVGCVNKAIHEIEYAVAARAEESIRDPSDQRKLKEFLAEVLKTHDFTYQNYRNLNAGLRLKIPTEEELHAIYVDMHKLDEKDFRNCAACGYNSCYQMAVAVFNGLNKAQNCHLYQEKELQIEQQALRQLHYELTNVFDTMSDGVIVLNQEGRISHFNPAAQNIIGHADEALLGIHVVDLFCGQAPRTLNLFRTGESFYDKEIMIDGRYGKIHATCSGKPVFNEQGKVIGATIILRPMAQVQELVNTFSGQQASFSFDSIIGEDKQLRRSVRLAMMASANNSTVLLQSESGTGKEVFAQAIHNSSSRSSGPFVAINCAALPRELVGSELFGYAEGAFTGAKRGGRPGKFELANHGTLLLDEIGDMPLEQQAVLLRAIQEKVTVRVGGDTPIPVDVRLIAATNKDLLGLVDQGRFRADLYYRLNVVRIAIPPLRERRHDIKLLFSHFLSLMSPKLGRYITEVDPAVISCLEKYNWPGNIRELQNVVERILLVSEDGRITLDNLPREIILAALGTTRNLPEYGPHPAASASAPAPGALTNRNTRKLHALEQEKERIVAALDANAGNVSKAAMLLGISRNTLYRKMKDFDIQN